MRSSARSWDPFFCVAVEPQSIQRVRARATAQAGRRSCRGTAAGVNWVRLADSSSTLPEVAMSPDRHASCAQPVAGPGFGLGVAVSLVVASAAWAGDPCPQNVISVSRTDVGFWSSAATASVVFVNGSDALVPWDAAQSCPEGCYDLPNGTLAARGWNDLYGPGDTHVSVSDEYVVTGTAGPPLAFEVVLQLAATIETEGTASADMRAGGTSSPAIQLTATGSTQTALPIVAAPGTPFQVSASAAAVGGHYDGTALAVATIRFRGLPRGYLVTSCQGYDLPTPTRAATWGGVKALYRSIDSARSLGRAATPRAPPDFARAGRHRSAGPRPAAHGTVGAHAPVAQLDRAAVS